MQPRRRLNVDRQGPNLVSFGSPAEGFFWGFSVPIQFPMCSSMCSQQNHTFVPFALPKVLPFSALQLGQGGRHSICQRKLLFWVATNFYVCFFVGQSNWLIAPKKKKKTLGKQPPSNELKHEYTTIVQYTSILCFPCISNLTQAKSNDEEFQHHNLHEGGGVGSNFFFLGGGGGGAGEFF